MTVSLLDVTILMYAVEIKACEKRLEWHKKNGVPLIYKSFFPHVDYIKVLEEDLESLKKTYNKLLKERNHV